MASDLHSIDPTEVRKRAHNPSTQHYTDAQIDDITSDYEHIVYHELQRDEASLFSVANDGAAMFNAVLRCIKTGAAAEIMSSFDDYTQDAKLAFERYNALLDRLKNADKETPIVKKTFGINDGLDESIYETVDL